MPQKPTNNKKIHFSITYFVVIIVLMFLFESFFFSNRGTKQISYNQFRDYIAQDSIQKLIIYEQKIYGVLKDSSSKKATSAVNAKNDKTGIQIESLPKKDIGPSVMVHKNTPWNPFAEKQQNKGEQFSTYRLEDPELVDLLQTKNIDYEGASSHNWFSSFLSNWILPIIILVVIWGLLFRKVGMGGGNALNLGQSKSKIVALDEKSKIKFENVAGVDEAKAELEEVVDFLSTPEKFSRLGGRLPKGLLLIGPPGCGKTLLAKAVAGEAGVPFFSISGSDFVEIFVGVGASRVRDLFKQAKEKAPCIIFIDEIDAIGKSRAGQGSMGGHDERESTLNQLLVEMDGFDSSKGVILMGATNRPEVLDKALLRPGRFDRQVLVDRPDLKGREQILEVHCKTVVLSKTVNLNKLAAQTPGFSGADLANICNEAALLASRKGKDEVEMEDFAEAIERVIAGLEKKNRLINPKERKIVAFHESGHAIIGHFTMGADPVQKVSIVPRGLGALGYTIQAPLEDRFLMSENELNGKIRGLLGGRAAEQITFGEISTGASNDLERVFSLARNMISVYGMSNKLPNLSLVEQNQNQFLGMGGRFAKVSEETNRIIDLEIIKIIHDNYQETIALLESKKELLEQMAHQLLEKEVLDEDDVIRILGKREDGR
ncbi:MAG: ATP-dependent zinc metalloprotease FtsH [Bacteroidales bacterium]